MESLYLLIPISALLVLALLAVFGWALNAGQFEDLEHEADRILTDDAGVAEHIDAAGQHLEFADRSDRAE